MSEEDWAFINENIFSGESSEDESSKHQYMPTHDPLNLTIEELCKEAQEDKRKKQEDKKRKQQEEKDREQEENRRRKELGIQFEREQKKKKENEEREKQEREQKRIRDAQPKILQQCPSVIWNPKTNIEEFYPLNENFGWRPNNSHENIEKKLNAGGEYNDVYELVRYTDVITWFLGNLQYQLKGRYSDFLLNDMVKKIKLVRNTNLSEYKQHLQQKIIMIMKRYYDDNYKLLEKMISLPIDSLINFVLSQTASALKEISKGKFDEAYNIMNNMSTDFDICLDKIYMVGGAYKKKSNKRKSNKRKSNKRKSNKRMKKFQRK